MKANASKHKAMSYGRMEERIRELEADVAEWHRLVDVADAEEDKLYGRDKTGEEMPDWVIPSSSAWKSPAAVVISMPVPTKSLNQAL
jgi:hypothetical protein